MHQISISVLLPVYNGEKYLEEAVQSILAQTLPDFELIILDDGSLDSSRKIAEEFALRDSRVRVISRKNKGLVPTLNEMIDLANGKYLARMDADDISLPDRLKEQYEFMENHPEVGVCGSWYENFGSGTDSSLCCPPVSHDLIKASLLFGPELAHPSVFIRKSVLGNDIRYNPEYLYCEDYKLWIELIDRTHFAVIPKVLFKYRIHENQVTEKFEIKSVQNRYRVEAEYFARLKIDLNEEDAMIIHGRLLPKHDTYARFNELIKTILANNRRHNYLNQQALEKTISRYYETIMHRKYGLGLFFMYLSNDFRKESSASIFFVLANALNRSCRNIYRKSRLLKKP